MNTRCRRLGTILVMILSSQLAIWPNAASADGTPRAKKPKQARQAGSNDAKKNVPFDQRVKHVSWDGDMVELSYKGVANVTEKILGTLDVWPRGLAFHPDGHIAFLDGNGTSPGMGISYWSLKGRIEPMVKFQLFTSGKDKDDRKRTEAERRGCFWYFAGPLGFDDKGICYFSLGACSPNGIYKLESRSPVVVAKLHAVDGTESLQIPPFDKQRIYSTSFNGIYVYSMTPSAATTGQRGAWFKIIGEDILMGHSLVISPTRVLATALFKTASKDENGHDKYDTKTLLFDKQSKACWSLPKDKFGPTAMSWDGKTMIHFDNKLHVISEFTLDLPTEH